VLYGQVPRLGGLFAFAAMASLGLPGLAGFWGEMLAIRAGFFPAEVLPRGTFVTLAVIAAFGVILTTGYFLVLMRGMLQGKVDALPGEAPSANQPRSSVAGSVGRPGPSTAEGAPPVRALTATLERGAILDVRPLDWVAWSPLVTLTLLLGVAPGLLLGPVGDAARAYLGGL
jgi:NADH-quinone oxidoreductase subunit M